MPRFPFPVQDWNSLRRPLASLGFVTGTGLVAFLLASVPLTRAFNSLHFLSPLKEGNPLLQSHGPAKINFVPEAERPLDICVIGLDANKSSYSFLPDLKRSFLVNHGRWEEIQKQLYWLNFELSHGRIMNALPLATQVYVAVPDSRAVAGSLGGEQDLFTGYLENRCGWNRDQIRQRIHFFESPTSLVWSQDIGKILGKDDQGRWVLLRGPNDPEGYRRAIESLCAAYPEHFIYRDLPNGVSGEGGDEDLVRRPDGRMLLLVGRHRVVRYFQAMNGFSWEDALANPSFDRALSPRQVGMAREGFQKAFDSMPVAFLPARVLQNPTLGSNELFHLDMVAAVAGLSSRATAFVPTYLPHPVDSVSGQPLAPDFVKTMQSEFDMATAELKSLGYPVLRLPLGDHPVRSPANFIRFYDPATNRCNVLISKYPQHLGPSFAQTTQGELMARLSLLRQETEGWNDHPDETHFQAVWNALSGVWGQMDAAAEEPNPSFEKTKRIFEEAGIQVIPVADYPWGAGGLHCETLH